MPSVGDSKYPIIKVMHKSFKVHPIYGYTIECWNFEPVVKYWSGNTTTKTRAANRIKPGPFRKYS